MSFEKDENKNKKDMKEIISKSLKFLNRKRPNSAKVKDSSENSKEQKKSENVKKILEKLKSYKFKNKKEKGKGNPQTQILGKPPSGNRKNINKKGVSHGTGESISDRFSQISPIGGKNYILFYKPKILNNFKI